MKFINLRIILIPFGALGLAFTYLSLYCRWQTILINTELRLKAARVVERQEEIQSDLEFLRSVRLTLQSVRLKLQNVLGNVDNTELDNVDNTELDNETSEGFESTPIEPQSIDSSINPCNPLQESLLDGSSLLLCQVQSAAFICFSLMGLLVGICLAVNLHDQTLGESYLDKYPKWVKLTLLKYKEYLRTPNTELLQWFMSTQLMIFLSNVFMYYYAPEPFSAIAFFNKQAAQEVECGDSGYPSYTLGNLLERILPSNLFSYLENFLFNPNEHNLVQVVNYSFGCFSFVGLIVGASLGWSLYVKHFSEAHSDKFPNWAKPLYRIYRAILLYDCTSFVGWIILLQILILLLCISLLVIPLLFILIQSL